MSTLINQHRVTAVVVEGTHELGSSSFARTFKFMRNGECVLEVTAFADCESSLYLHDVYDNLVVQTCLSAHS